MSLLISRSQLAQRRWEELSREGWRLPGVVNDMSSKNGQALEEDQGNKRGLAVVSAAHRVIVTMS